MDVFMIPFAGLKWWESCHRCNDLTWFCISKFYKIMLWDCILWI